MTINSVHNDGKLVYTILTDKTAAIGENNYKDGNGFVEKTNVSGAIIIPKQIGEYTITTIITYATRNCHKITKLILPRTITTLNDASLSTITNIKELIIPASVTKFGNRIDAFSKLKRFIFERESKLTSIGTHFLQLSYKITELILPSSVQSIGEYFLYDCTQIRTITYCGSSNFSGVQNCFMNCGKLNAIFVTSDYLSLLFGGRRISFSNQCYTKNDRKTCQKKANYWFKPNILYITILLINCC